MLILSNNIDDSIYNNDNDNIYNIDDNTKLEGKTVDARWQKDGHTSCMAKMVRLMVMVMVIMVMVMMVMMVMVMMVLWTMIKDLGIAIIIYILKN